MTSGSPPSRHSTDILNDGLPSSDGMAVLGGAGIAHPAHATAALVPHQKQFVLGPVAVQLRPDWIVAPLTAGLVLSHCPKLRTTRLRSRDGRDYWLLGLAVASDAAPATIAERFAQKSADEIEDWTGFWAGKWALISAERCWQDASGCLGFYYRRVDGAMWISSSPALLGDHVPGAPRAPRIPWQVTHRMGIDWIPAPLTTREEVYKALPMRSIDPMTGAIRAIRFAAADGATRPDDVALAAAFTNIMANWAREDFRDKVLGLTAGLDTRTVLAAAHAAGIAMETVTVEYPNADRRDVVLPPRIAASIGVRHRMIARPSTTLSPAEIAARAEAVAEHMDGATFHPVNASIADGLEGHMHVAGRTIAGGHVLGLARCYNWRRFARAGFAETLPGADQLLDVFRTRAPLAPHVWNPEPRDHWRQAMQRWLDSLADPIPLRLDWRDRFQIEQRVGAWNSGLERSSDLMDGSYFYPGNCLWIFHLLLLDPPEKRLEGDAQKRLVRRLSPRLAKIPVNPAGNGGWRDRLKVLLGSNFRRRLRPLIRVMQRRTTMFGVAASTSVPVEQLPPVILL